MTKISVVPGKTVSQVIRAVHAKLHREIRERRTDTEQLAILDLRPGESRRERARLTQRMAP